MATRTFGVFILRQRESNRDDRIAFATTGNFIARSGKIGSGHMLSSLKARSAKSRILARSPSFCEAQMNERLLELNGERIQLAGKGA